MYDIKIIVAVQRHCRLTVFCLCLLLLLQNGCGIVRPRHQEPVAPPAQPTVIKPPPPAEYKAVTGRATGVYNEAEAALQAGRYAEAEMLLERALRIEPQNPHYWYTLGMVKYRQKQYRQTIQFCLKTESLAASQPALLARSRELMTQAKKASGQQ